MKNFLIFIFIEFTLGQVFYPNQTKIFYRYYDNTNEVHQICTINIDGTNLAVLTNSNNNNSLNLTYQNMIISNSMDKIFFVSPDSNDFTQIFSMDLNGENIFQITYGNFNHRRPQICPNNNLFSYIYNNSDESNFSCIVELDFDTTGIVYDTIQCGYYEEWDRVSFSSDGSKIVFTDFFDGDSSIEIYHKNLITEELSKITNNYKDESNPQFSPDDAKIYFNRFGNPYQGGEVGLFEIDLTNLNEDPISSGYTMISSIFISEPKYLLERGSPPGNSLDLLSYNYNTGELIELIQTTIMDNRFGSQVALDRNMLEKIIFLNTNSTSIFDFDFEMRIAKSDVNGNNIVYLTDFYDSIDEFIIYQGDVYCLGDVDNDGSFLDQDISLIELIILDNLNYTTVADFNFDNNINLFDLLLHIDKVNHNNPLNFLDCL